MTDLFARVFAIVVGEEGGYSANVNDPGNWTGGAVGQGALRGTKYGISAAAYPTLDIIGLGLSAAQAIYRRDYWDRVRGDELPPSVALIVFDAAVNNGVDRAARWLQEAACVAEDGQIGPETLAAVAAHGADALCTEMLARRVMFMTALDTWAVFGLGWSRRLAGLPFKSLALAAG